MVVFSWSVKLSLSHSGELGADSDEDEEAEDADVGDWDLDVDEEWRDDAFVGVFCFLLDSEIGSLDGGVWFRFEQ